MDGSIRLSPAQRKRLLHEVRRGTDPQRRLRAHILVLLADGLAWSVIVAVLFTSTATVNRWRCRFLDGGVDAVLEPPRRRGPRWWVALVVHWVTCQSPRDFGFYRSRWTCATVVVLLREDHALAVHPETVRRHLHQQDLVWRRPRPVPGRSDPRRPQKLRQLRSLLRHLPADETAVFQDEVDVNTNPKVGAMWMRRGRQALLPTPGTNTKRYLAGSLHWRTGQLLLSGAGGRRRNADLFLAHLDDLRRRLRRYKKIHVICDNARFHHPDRCKKVKEYLARWGHRIELHFLPTYAPDTNPIERVWWHLHNEVTRNHRCHDIDELLDLVLDWLGAGSRFQIETSIYPQAVAA